MRYIGSKDKVLGFLESVIIDSVGNINGSTVADLFCGTACVAKLFKNMGAKLITNDYMSFSYALQMAFIHNNYLPIFYEVKERFGVQNYVDILNMLSDLNDVKGFFYNEYTLTGTSNNQYKRNYFSEDNAIKIDSIRTKLTQWYEADLVTTDEFYVLLASLIDAVTKVSNISGTYGAFLKIDDNRKFKPLKLEPIEVINSENNHVCFCQDIFQIINKVSGEILYLDPPYNSRQYPPYYHILETVTLYDNPAVYGKTGRRPYKGKISPLCIKGQVNDSLKFLIKNAQFEHIFLSYSTDGLANKDDVIKNISEYGNVEVFEQDYRRYKSNSNGEQKQNLKELVFYVRKRYKQKG